MAQLNKRSRSSASYSAPHRSVVSQQSLLTRQKALRRLVKLLEQRPLIFKEILQLVALFHFQPEDLTEAGMTFEAVKALEKKHPLLFLD